MSKTIHEIAIKGKDQTAGAFGSIAARAKMTGAQIRSVMGGALAAAGTFMGIRAISGSVSEMGRLSDQAMKAGTSVRDLTQASIAFNVAGLEIGVDQLTRSMLYLEKNTGKTGMSAFYDTIAQIAAIEDPAKRGAELVKNFGRSGMELQPLIAGGAEAVEKFQTLASIMPGLSDAAANAGDSVADAQMFLGNGVKTLWQEVIGKVIRMWSEDFPGGVRAGALNAVNWIETFAKKCYAWIAKLGTNVMSFGALLGDIFTMGPQAAWQLYLDTNAAADSDFEQRIDRANKSREEYVSKLKTLNVDDLANPFSKRGKSAAESASAASTISSKAIRNELVLAGSNDAAKLAAFGPQYQSETKKQTQLQKKLVESAEEIAQRLEDDAHASEEYKQLN